MTQIAAGRVVSDVGKAAANTAAVIIGKVDNRSPSLCLSLVSPLSPGANIPKLLIGNCAKRMDHRAGTENPSLESKAAFQ